MTRKEVQATARPVLMRSNIAANLLSKTKRALVKELPKCILFQM